MAIIKLARSTNAVPVERNMLSISIEHTLTDTWRGMSATYQVWGKEPCTDYLTQSLTDSSVFDRVSTFFVRREFARLFVGLVPFRTVFPKDIILGKGKVFEAVHGLKDMSATAAGVICDLIFPALIRLGMVSDQIKFSRHVRYGFDEITIESIKHDVAIYAVLEVVKAAGTSSVDKDSKYSTEVLAELLADAFRPVGLLMLDVNNLSSVVDSLTVCVRASIDPSGMSGRFTGSVPSDWKNHPVVAELAKNLIFVNAALAIPPGSDASIKNVRLLDKWATVVLAAIKSSPRYRWVGKAEALRHFGLQKVRDVKGKIVSAVFYREMEVQPVAQCVRADADDFMPSAKNLSATRDQIAASVQEAYGAAKFSTSESANMVWSILTAGVEAGWTGYSAVYVVGETDEDLNVRDAVILMCRKLWVEVGEDGAIVLDSGYKALLESTSKKNSHEVTRFWQPKWWYVVDTDEKNIDVHSGRHDASCVITSDYAEVLLAHAEFTAKEALPPRAQILGPEAFATRMVDFDARILQPVKARYSFHVDVNGIEMRGNMNATDFIFLRSQNDASLVRPHFNQEVLRNYAIGFQLTGEIIKSMEQQRVGAKDTPEAGVLLDWVGKKAPSSDFFDYLKRTPALALRRVAGQLSDSFRMHLREMVVERTLVSLALSQSESDVMRSRLQQRTFMAYADVVALQFFMHLQGFDTDAWKDVIASKEMARVCVELG